MNSLGIPALLNVVPSSSDASDLKSIGFGSPDSSPNSAKIWRTCWPVVSTVLAHSGDTQQTTETVTKQQELVVRTNRAQEHEINLDFEKPCLEASTWRPRDTTSLLTFQTVNIIRIMTSQNMLAQSLLQPRLPCQLTPSAYQLPSACRYPSTQGPKMLSSWLSARGILPTTPHQ